MYACNRVSLLRMHRKLERFPFVRTGRPGRTGSPCAKWKAERPVCVTTCVGLACCTRKGFCKQYGGRNSQHSADFLCRLSVFRGRRINFHDCIDDFVLISCSCIFCRRNLAKICSYFEDTVPRYHGNVFRSHFRLSPSTFEMLCQWLAPSEHFPKENSFGRPRIDPQKQITIGPWALANQESSREILDRFNVSLSSVSRCLRRVTKALVDVRCDLIH